MRFKKNFLGEGVSKLLYRVFCVLFRFKVSSASEEEHSSTKQQLKDMEAEKNRQVAKVKQLEELLAQVKVRQDPAPLDHSFMFGKTYATQIFLFSFFLLGPTFVELL